ncbi:hypothetical protein I3843_06G110500 [Carya illinoinensis]|uniref:C2H2-type domain-containing protein n=1 Tax=Carya illinoinensis TaxID=32201 RepID=A0A922EUS0_CARIL|nr:hypothetical protein I3842_06G116600 [Carya illinoinensis]KAG7975669.1 hypothetical protein I3843_06G110500 [Carya illinoinensis]
MKKNMTSDSGLRFPSSPHPPDDKARRKKRSKVIRIDEVMMLSSSGVVSKPKHGKKPYSSSAPKIMRPCSECGKKFWSWKALFGHMRCHPERQWRGINPPLNLCRPVPPPAHSSERLVTMTKEDEEAAACLLMMANGGIESKIKSVSGSYHHGVQESSGSFLKEDAAEESSCRFECLSCKKVFGSHQDLGWHRASHKNVKGCFAITRSDADQEVEDHHGRDERDSVEGNGVIVLGSGHKCSICLRVFSSGQALGGHKRCHWEKGDEPSMLSQQGLSPSGTKELGFSFDLNMHTPVEEGSSSSYASSRLTLDLRLGLC